MAKFANKEEYEKWKAGKTTKEACPADDSPDNAPSAETDVAHASKKNKNDIMMIAIILIIALAIIGSRVFSYLRKLSRPFVEVERTPVHILSCGLLSVNGFSLQGSNEF